MTPFMNREGDTGMINKLIHLWKFADDADRRAHWAATVVRRRFERLCRFLTDHRDRYATAVFSRTHPESLLGADGVKPLGRYV
jgi:hypothetical protein